MEKVRPNIRIEIHNNLKDDKKMESEDISKCDHEEGEISEDNNDAMDIEDKLNSPEPGPAEVSNKVWPNTKGIFTTGINIFDKQEQEKLQERAKRFSLKPEEIRNFTDSDLAELHESLGITADNGTNIRFDAVHLLGTDEMNTEDILEYFVAYAPSGIEWITENSCNVTWMENISAARAIFYISKGVKDMPARGPCNSFAKEFLDIDELEPEGTGESILLKNKNREVELKLDDDLVANKVNLKNSVDISEITIPIPPGYWRLGEKHPKAKCLLLRFALKTDKKPYKVEKFSKYFKKYGSISFGGIRRVISESKKKELKGIFERNKELSQEKNPWGYLAKNWNHDAKFRERERESVEEPNVEIKNSGMLVRLGTKRKHEDLQDTQDDNEEIIDKCSVDPEEEQERKKRKIPRMRMYADEEEEKLKRRKLLQTIKKQADKLSKDEICDRKDLRNVLGITNKKEEKELEPDIIDLGTRLKNRTKHMVFTVERDIEEIETYDRKENVRSDIRSLIEERRTNCPLHKRAIATSETYSRIRRSHPYERSPSRRHRRRSPENRRRSPERTLHSDRMYSLHRYRRRHSDYAEEEPHNKKPKSKVAVVIKRQKKPTVASTIWSRVQKQSESETSSESESSQAEETSSSEDSDAESDDSSSTVKRVRKVERPGFREGYRNLNEKLDHISPLKITMTNDHFRK